MDYSTMWLMTCLGIVIVLFMLAASTALRCLSSNSLASILQIGALVTFIVLFAILFLVCLGSNSDYEDNLEGFTKKAKARAKNNYLKLMAHNLTQIKAVPIS
ncbi:hypothetical protein HDE_09076 [Halotydeus destructor]|nr:hypothetical protein HDE_09076 [Halotydeus destructor]